MHKKAAGVQGGDAVWIGIPVKGTVGVLVKSGCGDRNPLLVLGIFLGPLRAFGGRGTWGSREKKKK